MIQTVPFQPGNSRTLKRSAPPTESLTKVEPTELESFESSAGPGVSQRGSGLAAAALLALAGVGVLTGAARAQETGVEFPASQAVELELAQTGELSVELAPVEEGRVDLLRQGSTGEDGSTQLAPLSPFGVELGDGVFFDLNGNLSLVATRAFQEAREGDYSQVRVDPYGWNNETEVRIRGERLSVVPPGFGTTTTMELDSSQITVSPPGFSNDYTITRRGDRTVIDPPGFNNSIEVFHGERSIVIDPPGFNNSITIRKDDNSLRVNPTGWGWDQTVVRRDGDTMTIDPDGWFNNTTIHQDGNRTTYNPPGWRDSVTVNRGERDTTIDRYGWSDDVTIHHH